MSFRSRTTSMTGRMRSSRPWRDRGARPAAFAADVDDVGPVGDQLEGLLDGRAGSKYSPPS